MFFFKREFLTTFIYAILCINILLSPYANKMYSCIIEFKWIECLSKFVNLAYCSVHVPSAKLIHIIIAIKRLKCPWSINIIHFFFLWMLYHSLPMMSCSSLTNHRFASSMKKKWLNTEEKERQERDLDK